MLNRLRRAFRREPRAFPGLPDVSLTPIGYVRNGVKEPMADGWANVASRVVIRPELTEMLLNLGDYSHVVIVFWPHRVPDEVRGSKPQLHPRDDEEFPLMGVLATRSQIRPNPVLVSPVPLLAVKGNVLKVRGLDAIDGTPVLDVKPYLPHHDAVPDARVPKWVEGAQSWRNR
ncbi:MAG TPA: tRNA (N6-threonylcarbamoyladenosine(37)-N6)-methyltransferase TrmO [Dehalococcoidia bacterium]